MIDKDKVIQLAKEAGGTPYVNRHFPSETAMGFSPQPLQDFAQAIYRQGLEDAISTVKAFPYWIGPTAKEEIATAIRSLKESTNG